jgi:hypothetical protein
MQWNIAEGAYRAASMRSRPYLLGEQLFPRSEKVEGERTEMPRGQWVETGNYRDQNKPTDRWEEATYTFAMPMTPELVRDVTLSIQRSKPKTGPVH